MSGLALLMAGGQGSRMRQTGVDCPKPLVKVADVTLIERNAQQLLKHGFDQIIVSIGESQTQISEFVQRQLSELVTGEGGSLHVLTEDQPLGNIGSTRMIQHHQKPAIVVYADNLTSLNLRDVFDFHEAKAASMTVAVHSHEFRMPFGEVQLQGDAVCGYDEKPISRFNVCSAISVLGPEAMSAIPPNGAFGISQLVQKLIQSDQLVAAFTHAAPWIDVNDQASLQIAERLVKESREEFEFEGRGTEL